MLLKRKLGKESILRREKPGKDKVVLSISTLADCRHGFLLSYALKNWRFGLWRKKVSG